MQFLNPRCSAALKKAGPIVDKLAPKFRETLKFLKKNRKFQGLPDLISNLSTMGSAFFRAAEIRQSIVD